MNSKVEKASLSNKLPSYKNPPVNEVVCGMRFRPIDRLRIPHIGLLWDKFRAEYPIIQHAPPIASNKGEMLVDKVTGLPLPRVWFVSDSDDQLIQFQNDRFYFNWRKRKNDYPHYTHVISNFKTALNSVKDVFKDFDLGELEPVEYELTYINHIPKGIGWKKINDLTEIFTDFSWNKMTSRFLPNPEEISWATKFSFPEKKSHLIISLKHAITEDELPTLIYELKAIGNDSDDTIHNWLDLAHEWIVRGFTDLTTEKMHEIWGLEENV